MAKKLSAISKFNFLSGYNICKSMGIKVNRNKKDFLKKAISLLQNPKVWFYAIIFYFLAISTVYGVMSIVKHSHYETFADLGIFNQGIWQFSRFQWPISTFHLNRPFLGDHFDPILIVLAPFYWIFSSEKTLLFIQPFIILSAIIPIYLISYHQTKSKLFGFSMVIAYSFYIPLQHTIFYDFHDIVFVPPLFAWAYYFFIHEKKIFVSLFLVLLLLTKEEVGFFVAAFGLFLFIFQKRWRLFGLAWLFVGIIYSLVVMHIIIPAIGGNNLYFNYGSSGSTPTDVVINFIKNPKEYIQLFYDKPVKVETLKQTFWPFAYLPLFSPVGSILSLEQFASRFLDQRNVARWRIGDHYSATMTIVVVIGTIWAVNFYTKLIPKYRKYLLILFSILILVLTRVEQINRSAVLLIKRPQFWARSSWMDYIDKAISMVPKDKSVAAQNNIISHLSTRKNVYDLNHMDKAEYIVVDFHKGQSSYGLFGEANWKIVENDIRTGITKGKYEVVYNEEDVFLVRQSNN